MAIPIYQVDAFTAEPFRGNPAAVCLLDRERTAGWMQAVAQEMNLSETAFLVDRQSHFDLRWFTPGAEVDLCGHATLASAHVLWETERLPLAQQARFQTRSGLLSASRLDGAIELDFPAVEEQPADLPEGVAEALGVSPVYVGRNRFDYLVAVADESEVRGLQPRFHALQSLQARGVMVTARANTPGYDFVSRFFAPGVGIDEDPVTGSAHCCLGPYWSKQLGKKRFRAYQASARGGDVQVRLAGDRVHLAGQAVMVWHGRLLSD